MKPSKLLFLGGVAFGLYKLYENLRVNPNETHLEGWQETAKHMRPTPKTLIELESESFPRAPMPAEEPRR
jgi:hypothetical protein